MKREEPSTIPTDRLSFLWFGIATLLNFFWTIPAVMWVQSTFMMRFMRTQRRVWPAFLLVWLSAFVTLGVTLRAMLPFELPIYLVTIAVSSLTVSALPYLADRLLAHRIPGFASTLVFPLASTAMDFVGTSTNPMGSMGAFAYAIHDNLVLLQLLSITGMAGITFLVSWLGPVVNWAWERSSWQEIRRGVAIYVGVLLLVTFYGSARLALAPTGTGSVRVHGLTVVDMRKNWSELHRITREDGWEAMRRKAAEYQDLTFEATIREVKGGAQLVFWSEMALMIPKEDEAPFIARGQQVAREHGIYLAMPVGTVYSDDTPSENKLLIVDPAGNIVLEHYKYGGNMFEGFKPGDGILRTAETPFGTLSGVICWDTDFPAAVRQAGRNGTDILLSPSMDFRAIDPMHAHMARYRAIENGVVVLRQADNGLSVFTDPYGRILASVDYFEASQAVTIAQVPANAHVFALYPLIGDLFGWLTVAGLAGVIAWGVLDCIRARRRVAPEGEGSSR